MGYGEFLEQPVSEKLLARQENQLRRKMQAARFPYAATSDQFDFTLRPELKRTVMLRFFDSSFVTTAGSLILIGPSGVGKTHLAMAILDRLLHHGEVFYVRGSSYRLRGKEPVTLSVKGDMLSPAEKL